MSGTRRTSLVAGAAETEITPKDSQFLFGYPHVKRYSTGVHDPLLSSSLYLSDGISEVLFIANDIIFIPKQVAVDVRRRIEDSTGIPASNIMVTATHTHSGPLTMDYVSNKFDSVVPKTDAAYVAFMSDRIVESAAAARESARPARVGLATADGSGVGTNRRNPGGPADPEVPVLLVRSADGDKNIALMTVYSMHPTVLHEDSTLISGDFPGMTRQYLKRIVGDECPILYHTGPEGNQSPRHVTTANTFAEAKRLGDMLGRAVERVLPGISLSADVRLGCARDALDLPRRRFPDVTQARIGLDAAVKRLASLRSARAPHAEIRTAECDWFGAEETLALAEAVASGNMESAYASCLPAELQAIRVGPWFFVGWPGEVFIEYPLALKKRADRTFVIALANGELQGYIVTREAAAEGGYEASNALFAPETGDILVKKSLQLIGKLKP